MSLVRRHATGGAPEMVYDAHRAREALVLVRRVRYFGFELEREEEAIDVFPEGMEGDARRALARALARGDARHPAVRRQAPLVAQVRELHRRSGGETPRLSEDELAAMYEAALAGVRSVSEYRAAPLRLDLAGLVPVEQRERLAGLPGAVEIRGKRIDIEYDLEPAPAGGRGDGALPVARLRLPEKLARTLTEAELPELDRPLRFVVLRGPRGAVRASTLDELQEALERPWSPEELARPVRPSRRGGRGGRGGRADRREQPGRGPRRHR
jgi:hypothetical protein